MTGSQPERYLFGYLTFFIVVSISAATTQWTLESLAVIGENARIASPMLAGTLLAAIGLWHLAQLLRRHVACGSSVEIQGSGLLRGWRQGCSSFGCCLTMIGLQFVGGATNSVLMVALTLWMLAEAVLPWKREMASATGIALLTAGGLTIVAAFA
jgi:predicted metal-binding membrane protein